MNIQDTLTEAARRLEVDLKGDAAEITALGESLISQLATAVGQPGYFEAVIACRDILTLELGINAVDLGDAADAELRGVIFGFLVSAGSAAL